MTIKNRPNHAADRWATKCRAAEANYKRLAAELKDVLEYAGHKDDDCRAQYHKGAPPTGCTCGWTEMREKWRGK